MENVRLLFAIFLGGGIGATFRYSLGKYVHDFLQRFNFPYGTLTVNLLGCLIIGFLGGVFDNRDYLPQELRAFFIVGMLGGFTTFSAFGLETFKLLQETQVLKAFVNVFGSITFGLIAVFAGYLISMAFNTKA